MSNKYQECVLEEDQLFCAMKIININRGLKVIQNGESITFTIVKAPTDDENDSTPTTYYLLAHASGEYTVNINYSFVDEDPRFIIHENVLVTPEDTVIAELEFNQIIIYVEDSADQPEEPVEPAQPEPVEPAQPESAKNNTDVCLLM